MGYCTDKNLHINVVTGKVYKFNKRYQKFLIHQKLELTEMWKKWKVHI